MGQEDFRFTFSSPVHNIALFFTGDEAEVTIPSYAAVDRKRDLPREECFNIPLRPEMNTTLT